MMNIAFEIYQQTSTFIENASWTRRIIHTFENAFPFRLNEWSNIVFETQKFNYHTYILKKKHINQRILVERIEQGTKAM